MGIVSPLISRSPVPVHVNRSPRWYIPAAWTPVWTDSSACYPITSAFLASRVNEGLEMSVILKQSLLVAKLQALKRGGHFE